MRYLARIGKREFSIEVHRRGGGRYRVRVDGVDREVEMHRTGDAAAMATGGRVIDAAIGREGNGSGRRDERAYGIMLGGNSYPVRILDPLRREAAPGGPRRDGRIDVRSTMPGRIAALLVREGDTVRAGQGLVVVEAMKMENEIPAPKDGRVTRLGVQAGEAVESGALLACVE